MLQSQNNALGSNITETGDKDGKSQMADSIMRGGKTLQSSRTDLKNELLNNETSTVKGKKNRNANQSNNQTQTNNNKLIVTASENLHGKIEGVSVSRASANNKSIGQVLSKVVRLMPKEPVIKTKPK